MLYNVYADDELNNNYHVLQYEKISLLEAKYICEINAPLYFTNNNWVYEEANNE